MKDEGTQCVVLLVVNCKAYKKGRTPIWLCSSHHQQQSNHSPTAANMATRPCWASASRHFFMVAKSVLAAKPRGSNPSAKGAGVPGRPHAKADSSGCHPLRELRLVAVRPVEGAVKAEAPERREKRASLYMLWWVGRESNLWGECLDGELHDVMYRGTPGIGKAFGSTGWRIGDVGTRLLFRVN